MRTCKAIGCCNPALPDLDFCDPCSNKEEGGPSLSDKYPGQYKAVGDISEIDAYAIHQMFQIEDHSGCLQQASQKLLLSSMSNGINRYRDIREARDILTRWLQLNQGLNTQ